MCLSPNYQYLKPHAFILPACFPTSNIMFEIDKYMPYEALKKNIIVSWHEKFWDNYTETENVDEFQ